jgi:hypothetical protein
MSHLLTGANPLAEGQAIGRQAAAVVSRTAGIPEGLFSLSIAAGLAPP